MITVRTVLSWLDQAYPPSLAEDWDVVGLDCGDLDAPVTSAAFAVDPSDAVIAEAIERGANLLITHHPLLLRGIKRVRRDEPHGRAVMNLLASGIAHIAVHTNADAGANGVNDALARAFALQDVRPLLPLATNANLGSGRIGRLSQPRCARDVARDFAARLPFTTSGLRLGGDPERLIENVAVCGGAGDSFLTAARRAGVDLYVTGDLRHHPASDFLAWDDSPALLDVPHAVAEWLWMPVAEELVRTASDGRIATYTSAINTDPWHETVFPEPAP